KLTPFLKNKGFMQVQMRKRLSYSILKRRINNMSEITVIKIGILFNSDKKAFTKADVYVSNGEIIAEEDIEETDQLMEWDAGGNYVSPGFIDMHVHVFENYAKIGINADKVGIKQGVTTVVDAGSTGYKDFEQFKNIINQSTTEIL